MPRAELDVTWTCLFEKAAVITASSWAASLAIPLSVYPGCCCLFHLYLQAVLIHGASQRVQKWGILSAHDPLLALWKRAGPSLGNCSQDGHRAVLSSGPHKSKLDLGDHVEGWLVAKTLARLCTSGPPRKLAKLSYIPKLSKRHQGMLWPCRITPKQEGTEDLVKDSRL